MAPLPYKRILLKVSGEGLMGPGEYGLHNETVAKLARDVKAVTATGREVCLVIGGGNIFRGISGAAQGMDRASADYMGMLATVINALAVQAALEAIDVPTRVQSAIAMARDNGLPIVVFDMHKENAVTEVLEGRGRFTVITPSLAA